MDNFSLKNYGGFLIFAQNIDCWYMLDEAVLTRTHNLCFRSKIRRKCIPLYTLVLQYKSGVLRCVNYIDVYIPDIFYRLMPTEDVDRIANISF